MAEYFRRHPELLDFQSDLKISLFELEISVRQDGLDVRDEIGQASVGISLRQLTSSDVHESARYSDCQRLAAAVLVAGMSGIAYPSAAAKWAGAWNLVLFGDQDLMIWQSISYSRVPRPLLVVGDFQPLLT